jgi:hypothetical protein
MYPKKNCQIVEIAKMNVKIHPPGSLINKMNVGNKIPPIEIHKVNSRRIHSG